jgi:hypothetical protein
MGMGYMKWAHLKGTCDFMGDSPLHRTGTKPIAVTTQTSHTNTFSVGLLDARRNFQLGTKPRGLSESELVSGINVFQAVKKILKGFAQV